MRFALRGPAPSRRQTRVPLGIGPVRERQCILCRYGADDVNMVYRIVISGATFRELIGRLTAGLNQREICQAGISQLTDLTEFLVHRLSSDRAGALKATTPMIVRGVAQPDEIPAALRRETGMESGVVVVLGTGAAAGRLAAY
jgi:hypothetical protein